MHVWRRHLGHHQGADVAHFAILLNALGSGFGDFHRAGAIACGVDNVIELGLRGGGFEERLQRGLDVGGGEIDGVA